MMRKNAFSTSAPLLSAVSAMSTLLLLSQPAQADQVASLDPTAGARSPAVSAPTAPAPASSDTSAPNDADADARAVTRSMDNNVSVFGVLGYGYSGLGSAPGIGARYQKRLVSDVSIRGPKIHDDIGIEAGLDFVHYSWSVPGYPQYSWSFNEVSAVAGVVWNFWIGDKFAVYPKLEVAYGFGSASSYAGIASPSYGGLWFQGAGGAVYKVGPVALRGEAGWRAVRLGAGLSF
jgi:hypothetical protein